jgi:MFS family permease
MNSMRSFKHRNFRILYPASTASNIGTWAQRVAQDWLVLQLTGSGTYVGLVVGLQFLPALLLSMQGGKLADRFNKRRTLIICNISGGLSAAILGTLVVTGQVKLWHVFFFAFTLGTASAIDAPVRQSFTAEIVGKADLPNAVSLNSANFNLARLIGPGLSGLLIAAFGTGPSFLLNAVSYLFIITALLFLRERDMFIENKPNLNAKISEAFRYLKARPDIYAVMITVFFTATFGLNFMLFNTLMTTKVFGKGAAAYGALGSILAIGSLTGALISARLEKKRHPSYVMRGSALFGVIVVIESFAPTFTVYACLLPIGGCIALLTLVSANSMVQVRTDPAIRGRVMGIYLTIFMGGTPLGSPLIGWLSTTIGVRQTMFICGSITFAAATLVYLKFKNRIETPASFLVGDVLETTYENK